MKVKVISLPYISQLLYVLCFTRPRYKVSVYRTSGPLIYMKNLHVYEISKPWLELLSSPHLSHRLICELIGYSWSVVRPSLPSVVNNFKQLLLQNRLHHQSQILCGAILGRGRKVSSQHLGHMTKIAATPIYGKNPSKIFFSRTGRPIFTKLGM